MLRVALTALALLVLAAPAQGQLLKEIKESARQKVAERKERTRAHVIQRATEPVDSALERGIRPVDSLVSQAATGAGRSVARLGREDEAMRDQERQRLTEALAVQGRAELPGLAFSAGSDALEPGAEPVLAALADVLAADPGVFLLEGLGDASNEAGGRTLGEQRAAAVKSALVAAGVPANRLFGVGREDEAMGASRVSVARMQ
jgi:outer membrane protein OmpA-like peptidoglycan-associated protein